MRGRSSFWGLVLALAVFISAALHADSRSSSRVGRGSITSSSSSSSTRDHEDLTWGQDPKPTLAGYLPVDGQGSELYYAFWEVQNKDVDARKAPIILWLQGGPGCASTFGGFYELGPYLATDTMQLQDNPGSWARHHGLLLIDQPLGTGYSQPARNASIPSDELGMAAHLYTALQAFYSRHSDRVLGRPLIITGESYGGKYIPSIAHFILQVSDMHAAAGPSSLPLDQQQHPGTDSDSGSDRDRESDSSGGSKGSSSSGSGSGRGSGTSALLDRSGGRLKAWRKLAAMPAPIFELAGIAIGNGLTDPRSQIPVMSEAAHYMGLTSPALRAAIANKSQQVLQLIDDGQWYEAHVEREALRAFITSSTGIATMFDTRREEDYDPKKSVDAFLNLPRVKSFMQAHTEVNYTSCSPVVGSIMAADTMQSVAHLLPDVLAHMPVLLYQGQFDILDGVASSISWIESLDWPLRQQMTDDPGSLWAQGARVAGWKRSAGNLTHAVVYKAGHMVPHDQPEAAQELIEAWVKAALSAR